MSASPAYIGCLMDQIRELDRAIDILQRARLFGPIGALEAAKAPAQRLIAEFTSDWFDIPARRDPRVIDELTRRAERGAIPVRGHPNPQYMFPGDKVEFLSDLQTEKGPSAGICVDNPNGQDLAIEHSDCVEWFDAIDLRVERVSRAHDGFVLWSLT